MRIVRRPASGKDAAHRILLLSLIRNLDRARFIGFDERWTRRDNTEMKSYCRVFPPRAYALSVFCLGYQDAVIIERPRRSRYLYTSRSLMLHTNLCNIALSAVMFQTLGGYHCSSNCHD
jgi:hypothetical protein